MSVPRPPLPMPSLEDDVLARELADGAGAVLRSLRDTVDRAGGSFDARELKATGDAASHEWLAAALAHARPADAILSEEAADDLERLAASRVWIVDPLDGTREFAERHADHSWREDFAVHIALWERGAELTRGAVALPARADVLTSADVSPAPSPTQVLRGNRPLRVAVSRSRPPEFVTALADLADIELVPMGSAGFKVLAVVLGTVDAYLHGGGQYEWDSAAPVAVARAAGLRCSRIDGSALRYNQENPWLPDLLVCHPALEPTLRAMLDRVAR